MASSFTDPVQKTVRKIMVGRGQKDADVRYPTLRRRRENITAIWNNTYEEDAGLEKVVRLLLAISQFIFPGTYIRHAFWRLGPLYQDLAIDVFVLLKTAFPLVVLAYGWEQNGIVLFLVVWLMLETTIYIPTLIFASDNFESPRSYRRSKLLIFFNYLEVVFSFAVIHMEGQYMNQVLEKWTDAVYVSFMITSTIGFGEFYPVTDAGRMIVSLQSLFYLSYIALFISLFNVGKNKGYFGEAPKK